MKVLLYHIDKYKTKQITELCKSLGIQVRPVAKSLYRESLGFAAGITGMKKQGKPYTGSELPGEMLVFCGFDDNGLDAFLKAYKEAGILPVSLKAVLTQYNILWDSVQLYEHLEEEHKSHSR